MSLENIGEQPQISLKDRFTRFTHRIDYANLTVSQLGGIALATALEPVNGTLSQIVGYTAVGIGVYTVASIISEISQNRQISIGKHMDIRTMKHRGANVTLSDGTMIEPGQLVGSISYTRNIPSQKLTETGNRWRNYLRFMFSKRPINRTDLNQSRKELVAAGIESLHQLAILCQQNDRRLEQIVGFYGFSNLAGKQAERMGFDVYNVRSPVMRLAAYALNINHRTPIREAFMSRDRLIALYGQPPLTN